MPKEILLDADGLLVHRTKYFSQRLAEKQGLDMERDVMPFIKGPMREAQLGKVKIIDILPDWLPLWNWQGSSEDLMRFWMEGEREIDLEILEVVRGLRKNGHKVYVVSDNEENRAEDLMEFVGLSQHVDGAFFSCFLGFTKSSPEFFNKVGEQIGVDLDEIYYWDDDAKNVEVAKSMGIKAFLFQGKNQFQQELEELGFVI